jgi:ParB/RepB/Spo0J family partition protein
MDEQVLISLKLIDPNPYQPRQVEDVEAVAEIAASIKQNGLLQVPSARQVDGRYQLAFGHTRKAAFLLNGETSMPLILRDLNDLQMFELGVAENIKRRDLNPIEQADAMRRYMDEFAKTSVEAGEFFGVAEETVRQKVRLLKLPEPVQAQMRAGDINENTARSLLSMQKIAPTETVIEIAKKIKAKEDKVLPDDLIEDTITYRLKNVVKLQESGRDWPVEMKKFPNKLLPPMSEEAVGIYESQIGHLVDPPACNACPFHTTMRGSHYCGLKICFERKQVAWARHQLELASKNLGIKIYDKDEDESYALLDSFEEPSKKIFKAKDAGLRLMPKSLVKQYVYQSHFEGMNHDHVVVVITGPSIEKLSSGKHNVKGGKKTEREKAEMRMMRVYRQRRKDFLWAFTDVAKVIFAGVPVEAVKKIERWHFIGIDDRIPDEFLKGKRESAKVTEDFARRELIWKMIDDVCSHYTRSSMATILNKLQKQAAEWKIKIPASLNKLAEQFDAEILAAAAPKKG